MIERPVISIVNMKERDEQFYFAMTIFEVRLFSFFSIEVRS